MPISLKKEFYRKLNSLPEQMPFSVRSIGHYQQTPSGWSFSVRRREVIELFWIVSGTGTFRNQQGKELPISTDFVACYYPGDTHCITCTEAVLEYYWLTLDGPEALPVFSAFRFPATPAKSVKCPEWLFKRLAEEIEDISLDGLHKCAITAFEILSLARSGVNRKSHKSSLAEKCAKLIDNEFADPALNVNYLAERLKTNRSVLSREFHKTMNSSVIDYLILTRCLFARTLLESGNYTLEEIAQRSGFSSRNYFTRTLKKTLGHPPSYWHK